MPNTETVQIKDLELLRASELVALALCAGQKQLRNEKEFAPARKK